MSFEKVLFIFKDRKLVTKNEEFWITKFNHKFKVETFFIKDHLKLTNQEIVNQINKTINEDNIKIVLFEGDHANIIDNDFIKNISDNVKKGIFLGDDMVWHIVNLITAQQCDFVFSSEPISVLKYKELGIKSLYVPIESDGKIFKDRKLQKTYDVLHFGREKTTRNKYIEHLKENSVKVKTVTPYDEESNTIEKLAVLINQSKIVLNFAESSNGDRKFNPLRIFKKFYQTKGRIQMAGLSNVLCISEYCASSELLYNKDELPFFKNKDDLLKKLNFYLSNKEELENATKKFYLKNLIYEDSNYILKIKKFLDSLEINSKQTINIPFWYRYLFLNQSLRLRYKDQKLNSFLKQFLDNIISANKNDLTTTLKIMFTSIVLFLKYFPFIIVKKIINLKNE